MTRRFMHNGYRQTPDVCRHVFFCALGDWQVQVPPRARSDLGGALATFEAICEAHREHIYADHTEAEREAMRRQLVRMGASPDITRKTEGGASGLLAGVPLPRWWVDR